jgi:hypothetical protein
MRGDRLQAWTAALGCAALVSAVVLASGCSTTASPVLVVTTGAVIVDWTIRGNKDPTDCLNSGATTIHIALADSSGALPMEFVQSCTAFATTITGLIPDTYTGTVELLDASGTARTTSVNLVPFNVFGGRTVAIAVDFPANSFF